MAQRATLPSDIAIQVDSLLKQSGKAEREGDMRGAAGLSLQAWDSLPDPKASWDFYPQIIARDLLSDAVSRKDRRAISTWLDRTYETYGDPGHYNHFVNMLEGGALLAIGDDEAAYAVFDKVYERDGRSGFKGEDLTHLEWYLKERARRRD